MAPWGCSDPCMCHQQSSKPLVTPKKRALCAYTSFVVLLSEKEIKGQMVAASEIGTLEMCVTNPHQSGEAALTALL